MKISQVHVEEFFLKEVECPPISKLSRAVYQMRIRRLTDRMRQREISHVVIYGDRERCGSMEYFTGFDPRFEEALAVVDQSGAVTMIVGNEGVGYCKDIPFSVEIVLHQDFSLQGQPREALKPLSQVLGAVLKNQRTVGIIGYKYYDMRDGEADGEEIYDIPSNILKSILKACGQTVNFTREITGVPDGIRMRLYSAEEIAWAESQGNRCAAVLQRMFKHLKAGMREYELPATAGVGFDPRSMHPICNFGPESVEIGLRSPGTSVLVPGEVCGMCYGIKGSLISKVSIASSGLEDCARELREHLEDFYYQHFLAVVSWYETVRVGVNAGQMYESVIKIIGDERFGVSLNPSHYIGIDEWPNATSRKGAEEPVVSGAHMQSDIAASSVNPVMTSICEDSVVIADEALREELREQYPQVYKRVVMRQKMMRDVLHINVHDDVLPMSNLNGVFFPFMLNCSQVFVK